MEKKYDIGLPEFTVLNRKITESDDHICTLDLTDKLSVCPLCGSKLHIYKTTKRKVQGPNQFGYRVDLIILSHRQICSNKDCGNTVGEECPSIYSSCKMTLRLRNLLKRDSFLHTFDEYGISISAVSTLFKEEANELNKKYKVIAPKIFGIDELHLKKNYCGVFVNIEEGSVIEIKDNRSWYTYSCDLLTVSFVYLILVLSQLTIVETRSYTNEFIQTCDVGLLIHFARKIYTSSVI